MVRCWSCAGAVLALCWRCAGAVRVPFDEVLLFLLRAAIVATNMDKKIKERLKVCNRVDDPN